MGCLSERMIVCCGYQSIMCVHIFYDVHVYIHIHYAIIYRLCAHSSATCRFRFKDVLEIGESVKCQIW